MEKLGEQKHKVPLQIRLEIVHSVVAMKLTRRKKGAMSGSVITESVWRR